MTTRAGGDGHEGSVVVRVGSGARVVARWTIALVLLVRPACVLAQATLEYDHGARTARLLTERRDGRVDTLALGDRRVVRVGRLQTVRVRVVNTNTALYRFSSDTAPVPTPELEPLRNFLSRLGPYLPEVGLALRGPAFTSEGSAVAAAYRSVLPPVARLGADASVRRAWESGRRTERDLVRLDEALNGYGGARRVLALSLTALEAMRSGEADVEQVRGRLRDSLGMPRGDCARPAPVHLQVVQGVVGPLADLATAKHDLDQALSAAEQRWAPSDRPMRDSLELLRTRSAAALNDMDAVVTAAYRVERLTKLAASACAAWEGRALHLTSGSGRSATLRIEPGAEPEVARVADRGPVTYSLTVLQSAVARPALGLTFLTAPNARFATYGARATPAGPTEVFETGSRDARFTWGLTFGLTWRGLDARERTGLALWVPELTLGASDAKTLGVGTAASWSFLKLGVGALWVRHAALDGLRPGQALPNKDYLRTRETYDGARTYVSLSVFDWPPFLGSGR